MYNKTIIVLFVILITTYIVQSDRGMITIKSDAKVFNPIQRAIIAWDGKKEYLILSSDLYSSEKTSAIEVIPFKKKPEIKSVDEKVFSDMFFLVNREMFLNNILSRSNRQRGVVRKDVEVIFKKLIGEHNISIFKVRKQKEFVLYLNEYIKKNFPDHIKEDLDQGFIDMVDQYLKKGFRYFVLDIIDLSKEVVSKKSMQYTFQSEELYYPLKISSLNNGTTEIELTVITKGLLHYFPEMKVSNIMLIHRPIDIEVKKFKEISEDIYMMFKEHKEVRVRLWNLGGENSQLKKDIIAK